MYEMLVGYPPFYSDEPMTTCRKVMSFRISAMCILLLWSSCCLEHAHLQYVSEFEVLFLSLLYESYVLLFQL